MSSQSAFNTISPSGSDGHWKVVGAVSPVLILSASQEQRAHASIFNDANASLYLVYGIGGSGFAAGVLASLSPTGSFDVKLTSGSYYELPKPIWQGEIWGIWDSATGWAHVLQLGAGK